MAPRRQGRRSLAALAVSLALHALLALVFWLHRSPPVAPRPASQVIELTVFEVPAPASPASVPEVKPAPAPRPRSVSSSGRKVGGQPPVVESMPSTGTPAVAAGERADVPKVTTLAPSSDFAIRLPGSGDGELPHGHTETNAPDSQPDPLAMREYRAEKAQRSVQDLAENLVGETRSGPALLDPYFTRALSAVRGEVAAADPPLPKKSVAEKFAQALAPWSAPAARFGATGNPMAGEAPGSSQSPIARAVRGGGDGTSGVNDTGLARWMEGGQQMMATSQIMMKEVGKAQLVTVLELFQVKGGGVADATIVKSSGFRDFDEYALHRARLAFQKLEDAPESGMGISDEGWRSVWRFSFMPPGVRVELLRVVKGGKKNPFDKSVE